MESSTYVARSRSPIRARVPPHEVHRVPPFEERLIPVVDRVERTIEHIPVGRGDPRSRSPLLGRTYGVSGAEARMSAATPTVASRT